MSKLKAECATLTVEGINHQMKALNIAHDLDNLDIARTADIRICEDVDFKGLMLSEQILQGLQKSNFRKPSPIQLRAIPLVRCGFDLIVQAKAGTGKTLVIGVAALEALSAKCTKVQALVIVPTREIALQVKDVIAAIGGGIEGLKAETFIGGLMVKDDIKRAISCHIAVGTPGRLNDLVQKNFLSLQAIRLLVLDEADKLMEEIFKKDIKDILKKMPNSRQTVLCSATFEEPLSKFIIKHMNSPMWVSPEGTTKLINGQCETSKSISKVLLGVKQFIKELPSHSIVVKQLQLKSNELVKVLCTLPFSQCIVFSNYQSRAESLCNMLSSLDWPAISISGKFDQKQRIEAISSFRNLQYRVLVSTDLTARGIDIPGVDLVVNLDVPSDAATYLHRVGRAGRYGSHGVAITLAAAGKEVIGLKEIISKINGAVLYQFPDDVSLISQDNCLEPVCCSSSSEKISGNESGLQHLNEDSRKTKGTEFKQDLENSHPVVAKQEEAKVLYEPITAREEVAVQEARNKVAQAIRSMQVEKQKRTHSYEELDEELRNWVADTDCNISVSPCETARRRPDWCSSAEVVLAAAEKQLNLLKMGSDKAQDRSSETSTDVDVNLNERTKKRKKRHNHRKQTAQSIDVNDALHCNNNCDIRSQWEYDPVTGDSFCWDPKRSLWWKYDSKTENYFCYSVESKSYFFWDSKTNEFHPLENGAFQPSDPKCNERTQNQNGLVPDQNLYSDWFILWMTQLSQVKTYVDYVHYWKRMGNWK